MWAVSTLQDQGSSFHHGDLRRALIAATREVMASLGTEAVSLREVARRVGVSHNAPYRHFPSREALLAAVAAEGFAALAAAFGAVAPGPPLLRLGQAYVRFACAEPALFRLMFGPEIRREDHPALSQAAASAFGALRAAITPGEQAQDVATGAWALVHGLAHLVVDGQFEGERATPEALDAQLERIVRAFGL